MKTSRRRLVFGILPLTLIGPVTTAIAAEPASGWDKAAAAKSLDDRAQAWFDFGGSARKTGEGKVSCVSCHTTFFYAVARGRLGQSIGEKGPGPQEVKVVDSVVRRVENWEKLEVFYGGDKKAASRGTEAILDAAVLATDDANRGRSAPSESTDRAIRNLLAIQHREGDERGAWDWLDFALEPWETAAGRYQGAVLGAFALGSLPTGALKAEDEPRIADLRGYLSKHYDSQSLHARAMLLFASASLPGLIDDSRKDALVRDLIAKQREDGGWSLSDLGPWRWSEDEPQSESPHSPKPKAKLLAESDGYATGLVVYALLKSGSKADRPEVRKGLDWLKAHQAADGSWPAYSPNKDRGDDQGGSNIARRFLSDAGTALAVLALLESEK